MHSKEIFFIYDPLLAIELIYIKILRISLRSLDSACMFTNFFITHQRKLHHGEVLYIVSTIKMILQNHLCIVND